MRELNIDWAALHSAFQMNMPEVRCFLAVEDGRVLKLPPGDPALTTVRADPQRYIAIDAIPSRIQYQWLDEFIKSIEDENIRGRMEAAINGKGAFRRFKDILLTLPDERRRWFEYRDQMMRQRIIDWVREQGIVPLNEAPWIGAEPGMLPPSAELEMMGGFSGLGGHSGHGNSHNAMSSLGNSSILPGMGGNSLGLTAPPRSTAAPLNSQREVEALRDFLIEWSDGRSAQALPSPLELEDLAMQIAKRFRVKPLHP